MTTISINANVAQLVRASGFQPEGREFNSHHSLKMLNSVMNQKCNRCSEFKVLECFHTNKHASNNKSYICKKCDSEEGALYRTTEQGVISQMYNNMKKNSKRRGHSMPAFTKQEFILWLHINDFNTIFKIWQDNYFVKKLRPSADRLNEDIGYVFSNMQLITWYENICKPRNGTISRNGTATVLGGVPPKRVIQLSIEGVVLNTFKSIAEAGRITGTDRSAITKVCLNKRKLAGGSKWEYAQMLIKC